MAREDIVDVVASGNLNSGTIVTVELTVDTIEELFDEEFYGICPICRSNELPRNNPNAKVCESCFWDAFDAYEMFSEEMKDRLIH